MMRSISPKDRAFINQWITSYQDNVNQLDPKDKNIKPLQAWLNTYNEEVKISPILTALSKQITQIQSCTTKGFGSNLYEFAIHSVKKCYQTLIPSHLNDEDIEKLILKKDFKQLDHYFSQYPEDLVKHSDLVKLHLNLENLTMQDLLPILGNAAASATQTNFMDFSPYYSFSSKPREIPSFFDQFYEEIQPFFNEAPEYLHSLQHLVIQDKGRSLQKFNLRKESDNIREIEIFLPLLLGQLTTEKMLKLLSSKDNAQAIPLLDLLTEEMFNKLDKRSQIRLMGLLVKNFPDSKLLKGLPSELEILKNSLKAEKEPSDFLHSVECFTMEEKRWALAEFIEIHQIPLVLLEDSLSEDDFLALAPYLRHIDMFKFDVSLGKKILENCLSPHKLTIYKGEILTGLDSLPFCTELQCRHCTNLYRLPKLPACEYLDCTLCSKLQALPSELPACKYLNCSHCNELKTLPSELSVCEYLNCTLCSKLQALPSELPVCKYLDCALCSKLQTLSSKLLVCEYLDCSYCNELKTLLSELPACKYLNCESCRHLTTLPRVLPACRYLDYSRTRVSSIPQLSSNARVLGAFKFTSLNVDVENFKHNPIKLIRELGTHLVNNKSFPQVHYFEKNIRSEGIDMGGVRRDFVTRLLESLFKEASFQDELGGFLKYHEGLPSISPSLLSKEAKLSFLNKEITLFQLNKEIEDFKTQERETLSDQEKEAFKAKENEALLLEKEIKNSFLKKETKDIKAKELEASSLKEEIETQKTQEMEAFKAFGALLALCYLDDSKFKSGPLPFSESMFEALAIGDPKFPGETPSDEWFLNAMAITLQLSEQAKKSLIDREMALTGDDKDLTILKYLLSLDENTDWKTLKDTSEASSLRERMIEQAKENPTVTILKFIVQEMKKNLGEKHWISLQQLKPVEIQEKIEGPLNSEMLKAYIDWEPSPNVESSKLNEVKTYFESWVDANRYNKKQLTLFVRAVTGNNTLTKRIKAEVYNREQNSIPVAHTCFFSIEFTQNYKDQEAFNKALSYLLTEGLAGTGFGFA